MLTTIRVSSALALLSRSLLNLKAASLSAGDMTESLTVNIFLTMFQGRVSSLISLAEMVGSSFISHFLS